MKKDKSILFDKVLSIVVKKKFPHIKEFYVNCDEDNRCEVGINITYKGLLETNQSELENKLLEQPKESDFTRARFHGSSNLDDGLYK